MSTSQSRPVMAVTSANSQCLDAPGDFDRFFDFSNLASPTVGSQSRMSASQATSALTSPTTHLLPLDVVDEHAVLQPSHEYGRFRQQTSLPTSIEQMQYLNATPSGMFPGYNSGIDELGLSIGGSGSVTGDMSTFFYGNGDSSQGSDFIDPHEIVKQEEAQANIRFYPGMHQQAALARQAEQQKQQQLLLQRQKQHELEARQSQGSRRSVSSQPLDQRTEETIARVVNQIRQNSNMSGDAGSPSSSSVLPHVARSKKDEDDMDEDERLLNSEEGKKLSSKERRQLRNKVSARAFRSRRKEYISQLEGELAAKANEAKELQRQNSALMEENARFHALTQKLLGHAAFRPFLEELSRDPSVADSLQKVTGSAPMNLGNSAPEPKDLDPYSAGQQQYLAPSNNIQHVGMTFIPETPIDLSSLNLGPSGNNAGWAMPNGLPTFQQVFAVTELPSIPESIDFEALSGKESSNDIFSELSGADEDVKREYPEVESPKSMIEAPLEKASKVEETEEGDFDENDPTLTLFASSSTSVIAKDEQEYEPLFGDIAPEKVFARFELFVSDESDNQLLMDRFERMCARLESRTRRLDALLDGYL